MNNSAAVKYRVLFTLLVVTVLFFSASSNLWSKAYAQDIPTDTPASESAVTETPLIEVINPYFSVEHTTLSDGTQLSGYIINGPPYPPIGYEAERAASIMPSINAVILPDFPSYNWVFGCSAVSGAMIAAYFDRGAYPNMYTGPTDGGVMPTTDTSWATWSDGFVTYPNNPLIASHNGVDGRATRGSIDDYWVSYGSSANDPYITNGWIQHTWETAIGDYMKTSQSATPYNNTDGSTAFYNYTSSNAMLTCSAMEGYGIANRDGTYGRKLFYEARGYTISDCYNQKTDNKISGGFSLVNFQAEIDAGYPVLLNLAGHSIVGYGYDGSTIYIRDTWDNNPAHTYTMPWGGSYSGLELLSVSVVHPTSVPTNPVPTITNINPSSATAGGPTFTLTVNGTNFISSSIVRWNGTDRTTSYVSATQLQASITEADIASASTANVSVFNPAPGGGISNSATFTINNPIPTITNINPPSATAGGVGFTLTVNGTNFVSASIVRWNGTDRTTSYVSATQLQASITVADIVSAGTANVTVFNPTPGGGISNSATFTINNPIPTITNINPSSATAGGVGFTLTVNGTNFVSASIVRWNGTDRTTSYASATQLQASITAADIASAGTATVTVFNPTPGGGISNSATFTINNPIPTITNINPPSATAGGVGFTLTVNGTDFLSSSIVRWNGTDRTTSYISATQLQASITAADIASAGTATVTVFNPTPGGGTSNGVTFTVIPITNNVFLPMIVR